METKHYGKYIRRLRKKAGLTIRELATQAGTSAGAISSIERQQSSPTLATLQRILKALNMDFIQFFSEQQMSVETPVFIAKDMQSINDPYREYTIVFPQREDIKFEMLRETILPSEKRESEWEVHKCDVGGIILSGNGAKLEIKDQGQWSLSQGDAFYIAADLNHRLVNLSDSPLQLLTVYYPPRY